MNSPVAIDHDSIFCQFCHDTFEFHGDAVDCWNVCHHFTPNLDVEVLVGSVAVGGKNIITEPREGEYVSVKGLEVEVAPCAAHTAIVSRISSCGLKLTVKE